jgi:hypothetical protein
MGGLRFIVVESSKRPKRDGSEGGEGAESRRTLSEVQSCRVTTVTHIHTNVCKFFITSWHNNSLVTEHVQMQSRDQFSVGIL